MTNNACFSATSAGLLTPLMPWISDPHVSEILLNRPKEIYVEKSGKIARFDVPEYNEKMLTHLFQLITNENNQTLTEKQPLLSGSLLDGSRIQLVKSPVAKHDAFAIRRQVAQHFTLSHYQKNGFYQKTTTTILDNAEISNLSDSEKQLIVYYQTKNWDQFIQAAIHFKKNIVISGGTSSGKTTFLNACLREINLNERIIVLEDTREIHIPHLNQVNLLAVKGEQSLAKVSMQDLLQCSLRLRPDRIIMGEIRGKEILDFVGACSIGHEGSLTTIHANSPAIAFMRMTQLYKQNNVPSMTDADILRELKSAIDIIIQLKKANGERLVSEVYYRYGHVTFS